MLKRGVQANDPARARLLYLVELLATQETKRPFRVLSLGASGGLELRADGLGYELDGDIYGNKQAAYIVSDCWNARAENRALVHDFLRNAPYIQERIGCDLEPFDATTKKGQASLIAANLIYPGTVRRQRAIFQDAARLPVCLDTGDAADWLPEQLAQLSPGVGTLVWSSKMEIYLKDQQRARIHEAIRGAAAKATPDTPLYYARFDNESFYVESKPGHPNRHVLTVQSWPDERTFSVLTGATSGDPDIQIDDFILTARDPALSYRSSLPQSEAQASRMRL